MSNGEQKRLDRPELKEKIIDSIIHYKHFDRTPTEWMVDKAVMPHIPDIEEAKREERERIQKAYEGEWYSVTDTYCPEWIVNIRQALKGEK